MSEDVPLTSFAGDDEERDEEVLDDAEGGGSDDDPATDDADPPTLTYASSPDGAPCASCGETVEKRWVAGEGGVTGDGDEPVVENPDALVCPDCKEW
jgi:hypothetical protein